MGQPLRSFFICYQRLGKYNYFLSGAFSVVQPVKSHQHTRAARARKSANMVSANAVPVALRPRAAAAPVGPDSK